jgi:hypothetical protein
LKRAGAHIDKGVSGRGDFVMSLTQSFAAALNRFPHASGLGERMSGLRNARLARLQITSHFTLINPVLLILT